MAPSDTRDTTAYRDSINHAYDTADPTIAYSFNNARNNLKDRYSNPFGANYSAEATDAAKYAGMNELDQGQGAALQADAFNRKNAKVGALGGIAGLTAPTLVQTGGTQNTTQSGGLFGQILGAAAGVGSAALM